ncbi:hypothetical protein TNCV_936641 [Trichonephila clavipes]|nr:hypothetical protein TNCV_936641 [Trichonephila clavipes]
MIKDCVPMDATHVHVRLPCASSTPYPTNQHRRCRQHPKAIKRDWGSLGLSSIPTANLDHGTHFEMMNSRFGGSPLGGRRREVAVAESGASRPEIQQKTMCGQVRKLLDFIR